MSIEHEELFDILINMIDENVGTPVEVDGLSDHKTPKFTLNKEKTPHYEPATKSVKIAVWEHYKTDLEVSLWTSNEAEAEESAWFGVQVDTDKGMLHAHGANTLIEALKCVETTFYILAHTWKPKLSNNYRLLNWKLKSENHPEHGVMAYSSHWLVHKSGKEIILWHGIEPETAAYDISEDDEYAIEVTDEEGDPIYGLSFKDKKLAETFILMWMIFIEYQTAEVNNGIR